MKRRVWGFVGLLSVVLLAGACDPVSCISNLARRKGSTSSSGSRPGAGSSGASSEWKMNRVPLKLTMPAGWSKLQNNSTWLSFKPVAGTGAIIAFSDFQSNDEVDDKLGSALRELRVTNTVWNSPKQEMINGLRSRIATGTCFDSGQASHVKYALVNVGLEGNLLFIYVIQNTFSAKWDTEAEKVLYSIRHL